MFSEINKSSKVIMSPTPLTTNDQQRSRHNFYYCFQPIFIISRIFGLLPFTIHSDLRGNIERVKIGALNVLWLVISIVFNMILMCIMKYSSRNKLDFGSPVLYLADQLIWISGFLIMVISMALDVFNRNRLLKILRNLIAFDKYVN